MSGELTQCPTKSEFSYYFSSIYHGGAILPHIYGEIKNLEVVVESSIGHGCDLMDQNYSQILMTVEGRKKCQNMRLVYIYVTGGNGTRYQTLVKKTWMWTFEVEAWMRNWLRIDSC